MHRSLEVHQVSEVVVGRLLVVGQHNVRAERRLCVCLAELLEGARLLRVEHQLHSFGVRRKARLELVDLLQVALNGLYRLFVWKRDIDDRIAGWFIVETPLAAYLRWRFHRGASGLSI